MYKTPRYLWKERPEIYEELSKKDDESRSITVSSGKKVSWICSNGHKYEAKVYHRTGSNSNCPYCSNKKVLPGFNDLATTHPELAKELLDLDLASKLCAGTAKQATWICPSGHVSYNARVNHRTKDKSGCPRCVGQVTVVGVNDLATTHPEICIELKDLSLARDLMSGSSRKVSWICSDGHEWDAAVSTRTRLGTGCPYCVGQRPIIGETDLQTTRPDLAAELVDNTLASVLMEFSNKSVWWRCSKKHEWVAGVHDRSRKITGTGCPKCSLSIKTSRTQKSIESFLTSLGVSFQSNCRSVISPKELDIVVPDKKVAIEVNGAYWHSSRTRNKNYHYEKYLSCLSMGYKLIQIWDIDWENPSKRSVWEKKLTRELTEVTRKIGARECNIREISYKDCSDFLDKYHVQGSSVGTSYLGLFKNDELVGVGVFIKYRNRAFINISRYASSLSIVGGLDRLMKFFGTGDYVTYANHMHSNGFLYSNTDWIVESVRPPEYYYLYKNKLWDKRNFRKSRFKKDSLFKFEDGRTEEQLAEMNSIYRVYDAGKTRYIKTI